MSLFSDNLRVLRDKKNLTQEKLAESLKITRERYVKYEYGTSEAPYDVLKKIANFHHISIDLLLSVDIRKIPTEDLIKLEDNRLVLPIMVDSQGENHIEIVTQKVKAGYLTGYTDPEYIEALEHISLPFLRNGKFRAFPITGDSMPPHRDGSFIVGSYVERLSDITNGKTYIVLTKDEGVAYKRLYKNGKNSFKLSSDNDFYKPYEVKAEDILEVWAFAASISLDEFEPDDISQQTIRDMLLQLKKEIVELKNK
ncbi:XRE family transcriptional regulator [Elizabethkingia anophelis]|nr:XRE family transcriptional regulator [Elizabethkingia anophelis]